MKHKFMRLFVPLCFCILIMFGVHSGAQTDRGSVSGSIKDNSDAIVTSASVSLKNEQTGVVLTTKVNSASQFNFENLNPGKYELSTSAPGFEKSIKTHIQVDVGSRVINDVTLHPGAAETTITVSANTQQMRTDSASLGLVVEEKSITDLPLIYGNPYALEVLASGVVMSSVNPNIHTYDSGSATVSVNGSIFNSIDYKLDGAPDNRIRYSAYTPSTEFISQYRMDTANYNAAEGHSAGAFMNTQLKSGTNNLHGSLFGYYQNPNVSSATWQPASSTSSSAKYTFVREGFGVGGPAIRNKLFWFFGFEHSRQSNPNPNDLVVPDDAQKGGDFSGLYALDTSTTAGNVCTSGGQLTSPSASPNAYQLFYPDSVTALSTTATNTHYTRACIPGNVISSGRMSSVAKKYLSYYPEPQTTTSFDGGYNYFYNKAEPDYYHAIAARTDYTINPSQSLYAHLVWSKRSQPAKNNYFAPYSADSLTYLNRGVALGYTYVLNSSTVLNAVAAFTRFTNQNIAGGEGVYDATTLGMPSYLVDDLPHYAKSMPRINATDYDPLTEASGVQNEDDIWLGSVSVSHQQSKHTLNFGAEFRLYKTSGMSGATEQGNYTSTGNLTTQTDTTSDSKYIGFTMAQLELGYLSSGSQVQNSDMSTVTNFWALYLQDDWRVTPKLTINAGLRWEHETPTFERNGKEIVAFDFDATNSTTTAAATKYASSVAGTNSYLPSSINPTGGAVYANTNGYGKNPYSTSMKDFLPRVGFAYSATPKMVIRGGYGIFFDSLNSYYLSGGNTGSTTTILVPQEGYSSTSSVTAPTFTTATGIVFTSTLANPFPSGLTSITGNTLGYNSQLGQNMQYLIPHPSTPYSQRYSLGIQRQVGSWVVSADYVGNHGVHLVTGQISSGTNTGGREMNSIPRGYYSTKTNGYDYAVNTAESTQVTNPFYGLISSGAVNNLASSKTYVYQLQRPYPEFASINAYGTNGMSSYNALQVNVRRRFTNGLSSTVAYTWSKSLDATSYLNASDTKPWYGISTTDRPQRLAVSGIYQLPFGKGKHWLATNKGVIGQLVGGWQVQGIYQIQSGAPLSFTSNGIYLGSNPNDSHWSRSDYKKSMANGTNKEGSWFNPALWVSDNTYSDHQITTCSSTSTDGCPYTLPGSYQLRKMPIRFSHLRADKLNQFDFGFQRQFTVLKKSTLQFRAEAVNVLNHPVYSAPTVSSYSTTTFGLITSQGNQPRVIQFSGFLRF